VQLPGRPLWKIGRKICRKTPKLYLAYFFGRWCECARWFSNSLVYSRVNSVTLLDIKFDWEKW
jgi:hypothetical protein